MKTDRVPTIFGMSITRSVVVGISLVRVEGNP